MGGHRANGPAPAPGNEVLMHSIANQRKLAAAFQAVETSSGMDRPELRIVRLRATMSCSPINS